MALSLTAEQKELLKIFKIEEQYVIPSYQRPYSWEYDHCYQFYNDILEAFEENQDYFIGNIIIAKADNDPETLEVVDGQQRLITTLLLFKVLSLLQPEIKVLEQILEKEDWEGINKVPRVRSDVFEANDGADLKKILDYNLENIKKRFAQVTDKNQKIIERLCFSRFEANFLHFYSWIIFFINYNSKDLKDFTTHILKKVHLLPIQLNGQSQEEANEKALVIFETINNRGMNLEDADIFKAKLYNKAKSINEEYIFIDLWTDFKIYCDNLNLNIDDVFRYYSHVIRGKQGITSSETNLREFFINEKFSPFVLKKYKEVLEDLFKIIGILEYINQERTKPTVLAKWLQILDAYTNQYPKYAIINYLFVNSLERDDKFLNFLKSLTRYVYFQGSTTTVKFEIYNIIKQTSSNLEIRPYISELTADYFISMGRLKKGFALLAYYLNEDSLPIYNIDKIINLKDKKDLTGSWANINLSEIVDRLGNFLITDLPKKQTNFNNKKSYYSQSRIKEVRSIFKDNDFTLEDFKLREDKLTQRLISFFRGND